MRVALLLLISITVLFGDLSSISSKESAYPLSGDRLKIGFNYNKINDTIDVLNIKKSELGSSKSYGSIGDASGFDLSLGYGFDRFGALYYDFGYLGIKFTDKKLKNQKSDIYAKIDIFNSSKNSLFKTISFDIGYIKNSANDLDIKNTQTLNSMIRKIRPNTDIRFDEGGIVYGDNTLYIFDENGVLPPYVKISNMSDSSLYIRALSGFLFDRWGVNFNLTLKRSSIKSSVTLEPSDNEIIKIATDKFAEVNLNRDESSLSMGVNYILSLYSYSFEGSYSYIKILNRDRELKRVDSNHIVTSTISKDIADGLKIFIGAKAMLHQFNGVIPYLYNEYTKDKFDKKYGYAKVGFIYSTNLGLL